MMAALCAQSEAAEQNDRPQAHEAGKHTKAAPANQPSKPAEENKPSADETKSAVSLEQALYLIRSTLLTLNDANRTGDYTVMRELAAPGAQARYTPADLAQIFSSLRENHVDLSAVAVAAPQLSAPPKLEAGGLLRLIGSFSTQPRQINFDLMFQVVAGHWKWLGVTVTAPDAPASEAATTGAK